MRKLYLLIFFLFESSLALRGQDLTSVGQPGQVKVTGSFTANAIGYAVSGMRNRRDPFYWMLSGNLNVDLYGWSIPISATFSQQQRSFTQPFNQYGLSPRYKWLTLHGGYRSMNFSNYTLSGNVFLGAGVEVAPDDLPIRFSAMYGRFAKPIAVYAVDGVISGEPALERLGYGAKLGIGRRVDRSVELIMFKAKDNGGTDLADTTGLRPAENLVLGITTKQALTKNLLFDMEYALSAYTTDTRQEKVEQETYSYANHLGSLFTPRESSQFNKAILANLAFTRSFYQLKLTYRRIDPEYKTMGSVFLNNDLEDISGSVSVRAMQNKLSLSISGGVQRNNLNNDLLARLTRVIGALNASYAVSDKLNFNANLSNYSSNTRMTQLRELDSLKYFQVTRSAGLGFNYNIGSQTVRHAFFVLTNYQGANDDRNGDNTFYNANAGYQLMLTPQNFSLSGSLNWSKNEAPVFSSTALGPSIMASQSFFGKKVRSSVSASLLNSYLSGSLASRNVNTRLATAYALSNHHTFSVDLTYLSRKPIGSFYSPIKEFRGGVLYTFVF